MTKCSVYIYSHICQCPTRKSSELAQASWSWHDYFLPPHSGTSFSFCLPCFRHCLVLSFFLFRFISSILSFLPSCVFPVSLCFLVRSFFPFLTVAATHSSVTLRGFRMQYSLPLYVICSLIFHSYARETDILCLACLPIPTSLDDNWTDWMGHHLQIYLPPAHNFHRHVIIITCLIIELCVCLFCVILCKQAELSDCMGCVNILVTGRMCVYNGFHTAHLPLCKLATGAPSLLLQKKNRESVVC